MIKYIGSKRVLVPALVDLFRAMAPSGTVIDLFSGTSRVGHALKRHGYRVLANDHNAYAATLARCYVQADEEDHARAVRQLVREFNALSGRGGYFTEEFCERSRFFQPKNGARVDAIREEIARKGLPPELESILLVSLMEAADRVDSTTGVQMAYLKQWAPRAHNDLELRVPELLPRAASGKGEAHHMDANEVIQSLEADMCYLDPPYNQHKYLGNYHIWESLVLWDKPETYGIACKRIDCRERSSRFNGKSDAGPALSEVIRGIKVRHLVVSFNNEGYFTRSDIESMLATRGEVVVIERDFKRYVGAQIGIHNPKGEKVGEVSHLRNTEFIYVASEDRDLIDRIRALGARPSDAQQRMAATPEETTPRPTMRVAEVRRSLEALLVERGSLACGEAQATLGIDAANIRVAFRGLVADGVAVQTGAGRGTRYLRAADAPGPGASAQVHHEPTSRGTGKSAPAVGDGLREALERFLSSRRDASSQEAQRELVTSADALRPLFQELVTAGLVTTSGQRRGTRYAWAGPRSALPGTPAIREPAPRLHVPPPEIPAKAGRAAQQSLFATLR